MKTGHLKVQFMRDVSKRSQLFGVFADTLQIFLAELILRVNQNKDTLH